MRMQEPRHVPPSNSSSKATAPSAVRQPRFRLFSANDAKASRLWYRPRDAIQIPGASGLLKLFHETASSPHPSHFTAVQFSVGNSFGSVTIPNVLILEILLAHGIQNGAALGKDKVALIIEYWLAEALDRLEKLIGEKITVTELKSLPQTSGALTARFTYRGRAYPLTFSLPLDFMGKVGGLMRMTQTVPSADAISIMVAVRIAVTELQLAELSTVRINDILLADVTPGKMLVLAVFGERFSARAQVNSGKIILLERPSPMTGKQKEIFAMADTVNTVQNSSPKDTDVNDIIVKLTFELGRQEITVGDLRQLAPGYIFELMRDARTAVDIYAGQRRIGQGEIVQINETLGARVTRLFSND